MRHDVIMTGVGGRGVLTAGLLLAQAALVKYKHILWFPSYQAAMRGGPCECSVILSDEQVYSPVLSKTQSLIVIDTSQFRDFVSRVLPGGVIITETEGLNTNSVPSNIKVYKVPAMSLAVQQGDIQGSNFILLGAYLEATGVLPLSLVEEELQKRFGSKKKVLEANINALRQGTKYIKNQKSKIKD